LQQLTQAGGAARYMINNDTLGAHDRYDYVHAKYAVADGQRALVLSGNWKMTSLPVDPTWGNREWGVVVQSASLAAQLEQVFADDWNGAHRDILAFGNGTDPRYLPPDANFTPDRTVPGGSYAGHFAARTWTGPFNATPVLAPDTSLLDRSGLRPLLRSARSELLVEQLSAHAHWGDPRTGTPDSDPDPYLQDCIAAARAGAHVYVLLDSAFLDTGDTRNNQATVDYLNGIAANESLALQARLVNLTAVGVDEVHNKGVVVDNRTAVVGSLNWVRNSAQDNRELDLMLDDRDAAAYFRDVFFYDWDRSG
jgi:phosphatidylserine/phosphatidylglycerophosphate/cardiolipin synthase-like enzyme